MRIYIPGNLLLAGEYDVLEEGGLGLACAVDTQALIQTEAADTCSMYGNGPGGEFRWPGESRLFTAAVEAFFSLRNTTQALPPLHIAVNSKSFQKQGFGKLGFGSSAAVCAGLLFSLLVNSPGPWQDSFSQAGVSSFTELYKKDPYLWRQFWLAAVDLHRHIQGGQGSGYDVTVSLFGNAGLFTGGLRPEWEALAPAWLPRIFLVRGGRPLATRDALPAYRRWQQHCPAKMRRFARISRRIVKALAAAPTLEAALVLVGRAGRLFQRLEGEVFGQPLDRELDTKLDRAREAGCQGKAIGAGGEIGIVLCPELCYTCYDQQFQQITIATKGLRWEQQEQ